MLLFGLFAYYFFIIIPSLVDFAKRICYDIVILLKIQRYEYPAMKKIISLFLYGKKRPVPTLNRCMWKAIAEAVKPGAPYDDKTLEYFNLLWGEEQLDEGLEGIITKLKPLMYLSMEN